MTSITDTVQLNTTTGEPVKIGDLTVTPVAQALNVHLPFGGIVWNRPAAVRVSRRGVESEITIVDSTRIIQLGLLTLAAIFTLLAFLPRKEH